MESLFRSHKFVCDSNSKEQQLCFRVLAMDASVFIYVGSKDNERLDDFSLAIESNGTTVMGSSESNEMAQKISARLAKPVFISCNTTLDRITKGLVEQRLIREIREQPHHF